MYHYPDFSKYFNGAQLLPNEIMIIIHNINRRAIKEHAKNLKIKHIVTDPVMESLYVVSRGVFFIINETVYSTNVPFLIFHCESCIYCEHHLPNGDIKRFTFLNTNHVRGALIYSETIKKPHREN